MLVASSRIGVGNSEIQGCPGFQLLYMQLRRLQLYSQIGVYFLLPPKLCLIPSIFEAFLAR